MYDFHIRSMTELICKIKRKTPKAVEAALQSYWKNRIAITWSTDDVITCGKDQYNEIITEEEAENILNSLLDHHDASLGINWDTLYDTVDDFLDEKELSFIGDTPEKDLPLHVDRKWRTPHNRDVFMKRLEGKVIK